ncbi:MAG TPA: cysteine desulfurase-like protein [Candidatus Limnocylindria bacterium]|nr:cysteine desulfurase-like protein [Candidatus Limnocylindria bacterium]
MSGYDVDAIRAQFPGLALEQHDRPVAYFDGPGGTQVPQGVIDAMTDYYRTSNANDGGAFLTSRRSVERVEEARQAVADLYGANDAAEIKFGYNMTTLTFHLSRSIAACFEPGDEILVTTLDHEANVSPWQATARDHGLTVRTVDVDLDECTLDLADLERKLSPRTRLLAVGYASNAVGTINPLPRIIERAHAAGAWVYVDAVHYAPHGPIDVRALSADFLVTSPYKWFGPHLGALYGRQELLDRLPKYKVRPAHDDFETGTPSFEAIVGTGAAVDYLASLGRRFGGAAAGAPRREALLAAMAAIGEYELGLLRRLMDGLSSLPGIRVLGITDRNRFDSERVPTVAVTLAPTRPREAAEALGSQGIFTWDGDFYAQGLVERLGLAEGGGLLRLGIVHYNTAAEVDRLLDALEALAA